MIILEFYICLQRGPKSSSDSISYDMKIFSFCGALSGPQTPSQLGFDPSGPANGANVQW